MTIAPMRHLSDTGEPAPTELLIEEARKKSRRRRGTIAFSVVLVAAAVAGIGYGVASSTGHPAVAPSHSPTSAGGHAQTAALPMGPTATLRVAGSLAVGPTGTLYVAAPDEHRILARLSNGSFRVVAGTGTAGYSGDGGKAIRAELSDPTDLTFDARGELYFSDAGRVRAIMTDGTIETVAGNGLASSPVAAHPEATVVNGTPALSASFPSDPSIAFGPSGVLYVTTGTQLLRLTDAGQFDVIQLHHAASGAKAYRSVPLDENLDTLAIARDGRIYISGFNGRAIWGVATNGTATYVGYDRGSGGNIPDLVTGPDGAVYAENGGSIVRVTPTRLVTVDSVSQVGSQGFWATNFAFGSRGTLYADELPGNIGFETRQEIVSLRGRKASVLWAESSSTATRHSQ